MMGAFLLFVGVAMSLIGGVVGATFFISWLIDTGIPKMRWKKPQSPGAMIAYSMLHPSTRSDWRRDAVGLELGYVNDKLALSVSKLMGSVHTGFLISGSEKRLLLYAMSEFDRREEERKKLEALESVVTKFDAAYGERRA